MAIAIVARYRVRAGEQAAVAEALAEMAAPSRAEPGCLAYHPLRSPQDERLFVIFEAYRDQEAVEAHRASEHYRRLVAGVVRPRAESRQVAVYETLES